MNAALVLLLPALLAAPRPPRPPPEPAPPAGAAERSARLEAYLGFLHGAPSERDWRALGPEATPALLALAGAPTELPGRRAAALRGLSFLGGPEATALAVRLCGEEDQPFAVRAAALEAAGRLLPPAELLRTLGPVLAGARRLGDRAVAGEVLARHAPETGCRPVRARRGREAAAARPAFAAALAACAARGR